MNRRFFIGFLSNGFAAISVGLLGKTALAESKNANSTEYCDPKCVYGIHQTYGSYGNYGAYGTYGSYGTYGVYGTYRSYGGYGVYGTYRSYGGYGVYGAYGVYGVYGALGAYGQNGIYGSYGSKGRHSPAEPIIPTKPRGRGDRGADGLNIDFEAMTNRNS